MSMAISPSTIRGGLSDPVFEAQAVFRQIMNALARPGSAGAIGAFATPPEPLSPCVGAIAATLFDGDTKIWLDPRLSGRDDVVGWLTFHTAAPIVEQPLDAQFALVSSGAVLPSLESFSQGAQDYPDRSTTVILQVDRLDGDASLTLSGPGIKGRTIITPGGLPQHFCEQWAGNRSRFPRGVDMILAAADGVIGLPRTTHIQLGNRQED